MQTEQKNFLPAEEGTRMQQCRPSRWRRLFMPCLLAVSCTAAQAQSVQVLHWWKSLSEQQAVNLLTTKLAQDNLQWRDGLVPSGSGVGASIVLKSRILAGNAPEAAQLNGVLVSEWAELGLLLDIDSVAQSGKWEKNLFPKVWNLIQVKNHVVAAPLGVHRINTLFYNKKIFSKLELEPPASWEEFDQLIPKLQQAGITPLAQSSEIWQVATLFETVLLSVSNPAFYQDVFVRKQPSAFMDARFAQALKRLRLLKKAMPNPVPDKLWMDLSRQLADGQAAMLIMGDWVKGELNALGQSTDVGFSCLAVPGTAAYHIYDVDTLVMLAKDNSKRSAQEKLAQWVVSPALQQEYNQVKGSIPVLRNADTGKMDSCARNAWKVFSSGAAAQVPSFAHRMATDEISRDAMMNEIHRFFMDDQMTVGEAQKRMATMVRALPKNKAGNDAQDTNR